MNLKKLLNFGADIIGSLAGSEQPRSSIKDRPGSGGRPLRFAFLTLVIYAAARTNKQAASPGGRGQPGASSWIANPCQRSSMSMPFDEMLPALCSNLDN